MMAGLVPIAWFAHVSRAGWWSAAAVAGLIAAWPAVAAIVALAGGGSEALFGLGFGAVHGAITAGALVRLLPASSGGRRH